MLIYTVIFIFHLDFTLIYIPSFIFISILVIIVIIS